MKRTSTVRVLISSPTWQPFCNRITTAQYHRRLLSGTSSLAQSHVDAIRGAALLSSRRLIELRGPQASQFLQGLTTANIPSENPSKSKLIYSAFLNAQGRLLQDVFIYHLSPGSKLIQNGSQKWPSDVEQNFLIEVDANQIGNLMRWLKKYKLRAKVAIREVATDEIGVISAWNDSNTSNAAFDGKPASSHGDDVSSFVDTRAPGFGFRVLSRAGSLPASWEQDVSSKINHGESFQQYQIRRYKFGIPEGQNELPHETALVHDSNIDYMGGVDFRKGCYVGQELVIRTQHTGVVRKRILPCVLYKAGEDEPQEIEYQETTSSATVSNGADIKSLVEEGKRARSKGKWLAGVGNLGLALCRLEDMVGIGPAGDTLEGWQAKQWTIEHPPDSDKEDVMVKAFIPPWWQDRIRGIKQGG